jgi:hypothetical protein
LGTVKVMESIIYHLFLHQWQRKLVAIITATIIWVFVNHTITSTKTIPSIPIRVINLPVDKTILGLLPNGFLSKRTTLTLGGTKDVIEQLEPGDLEVVLDISQLPSDGIVQINKKNLVSLNPNFNLPTHITSVNHPEFNIKMSPILTEKIPIYIRTPIGEAPVGYEYLDIWPIELMQTISGPQEQVLALKNQGLELVLNLNEITNEQLSAIQKDHLYDDEVKFYVPTSWKKIHIPFFTKGPENINDPESKALHITFLRQQLLPIKNDVLLHIFYPLRYINTLNPETYDLFPTPAVHVKNGISILSVPLLTANVSKLFLEIVKDNIELNIIVAPQTEREMLEWSVDFIDTPYLEDMYVAFLMSNERSSTPLSTKNSNRERHLRHRFRHYIDCFKLYLTPHYPLELQSRLKDNKIHLHIPHANLPHAH